jgi:hypothetical protein
MIASKNQFKMHRQNKNTISRAEESAGGKASSNEEVGYFHAFSNRSRTELSLNFSNIIRKKLLNT